MQAEKGTRQRTLFRVTCEWGDATNSHGVMYPVFHRDYKVRGMIGHTMGETPLWYPTVPTTVQERTIRFKVPYFEDSPLPVDAWEPELLDGAYFCDPWRILAVALANAPNANSLGEWCDLYGRRIQAGPIIDLVFERPLHRLRGIVVRRGSFRVKTWSVLEIPALAESLQAPEPRGRFRRGRARSDSA